MKTTISLIALLTALATGTAFAANPGGGRASGGMGGGESYNGNGQTHGFTSSTGFVKERNDEQDHMDGKEKPDADNDADVPPMDEKADEIKNGEK